MSAFTSELLYARRRLVPRTDTVTTLMSVYIADTSPSTTATTHQPPPIGPYTPPLRPKAIRAVAASVRVSGQYDRKRRGKRIRMQYIPADEQEPMIMPGNLNLPERLERLLSPQPG